jgi:hypothetical protein
MYRPSFSYSVVTTNFQRPDDFPPDSVGFRICPIKHIVETSRSISSETSTKSWPRKLYWIPPYADAMHLLEKFLQHVEHIHHIFNTLALPTMVDRVYSRLIQQGCVKSGDMVLLMAIFGSATCSWTEHDCCERGLFSTSAEAHPQSGHWVRVAEDLLDIARRTTHVSIEGVQAAIILMFIPEDLEGFWRRCRSLHGMGILLARDIGLHCIDLPSKAHANSVQAEIGRRVWWHLVSTDW